jgi:anion-transporting  ArsA/GET3 family ATPase
MQPMQVLDVPVKDAARAAVRELVATRKVLVCVGSGGVGKTTSAATLGLLGATLGKRTLVITIDPAKRLANALGLNELSHAPQRIDDTIMRAAGAQPTADLFAMMLDLKAAWDDMLFRTAPDRDTAERILENRFYTALSRDLPGAHEFIACEALQHIAGTGAYDLVVLDTPPTSNALDFLEAPSRILAVLDNEAFRFFAQKKQSLGLRFLDGAAGRAQSVLARFAGAEVLEEMGDFIVLLKDLYDPLTARARDFMALLRGEGTRFLVVSSPQPAALSEARFFLGELARRDLRTGALIVNRVTPSPGRALDVLADSEWERHLTSRGLGDTESARLAAVLDEAVRQQQKLAALDQALVAELVNGVGDVPTVKVPRLPDAVHDARRLVEMIPWLAG